MKVGGIVVCLPIGTIDSTQAGFIKWLPVQDKNTPYTIRGIDKSPISGRRGVTFEEGVIGHNKSGKELMFPIENIREILPPEDIAEEVEDMMCVPMKGE